MADSDKLQTLLRRYVEAQQRVKSAGMEQINAKNNLDDCIHSLATFIVPQDAKKGEVFSIWVRDTVTDKERLLCMETPVDDTNTFKLYWRK